MILLSKSIYMYLHTTILVASLALVLSGLHVPLVTSFTYVLSWHSHTFLSLNLGHHFYVPIVMLQNTHTLPNPVCNHLGFLYRRILLVS